MSPDGSSMPPGDGRAHAAAIAPAADAAVLPMGAPPPAPAIAPDPPMARLGIIMLCHGQLATAARIARHWAEGGTSVAIHVDLKEGPGRVAQLKERLADLPSIHHVARRRNCEWGMFSLVEATLDAARLLLEREPQLTHVMLTSGSCLPLRPVQDLRAYLALDPDRDYIESVTAHDVGWTVGGLNEERFTQWFPFSWRMHRGLFDRLVKLHRRFGIRRTMPPGLVPHLGSQWWCLTRPTLAAILDDPRRPEFDRYFRYVWVPDESYFQTLARLHAPAIESRSLTLSKFDSQGKPYIFYDDHQQMLQESGCFVARKFWPRAGGLLDHFLRPPQQPPSVAEPQPAHIDRLINRAVARRALGRPGLYMQSRFPRKDRENGKTAAPYTVFQGFDDLFPDFRDWLAARLHDHDVHGHLFAVGQVDYAGGRAVGPGGLSDRPAIRDYDQHGFLTSLIRTAARPQAFLLSPRDQQDLDWFYGTDPNCTLYAITSAWMLPLIGCGMPFDDVRRMAARLQRRELAQMEVLRSVWTKARFRSWDLADFLARPDAIMSSILHELTGTPPADAHLPPMRRVDGVAGFLQALRNAGLRPQLTGDFPTPAPGRVRPVQE